MIQKLLKTDSDLTSLILRIVLAVVFFPHGAQKVLGIFGGYGFSGTYAFLTNAGFPGILVLLLFAAEFLGPIGLLTGLLTRVAAAGIGVAMLVASTTHLAHGFFINWTGGQQGEGVEFHILAIAISLVLVIKGGGKASLDGVIANK
ncbi:DoxX family protein [Leptospira langatensis]|uniref:DoxX family protein n=1 Tax=Leptospira langatensis TaxID=2484983 RepID=A0A5F1ZRQ6_9LEPT|nr:DoxX family protein [Leptospira langatensis]TGJ98826.1 DoxX family protein [Leptospira langatensis]TGL40607.1 DoxX family protein [Leptospira langatensis]